MIRPVRCASRETLLHSKRSQGLMVPAPFQSRPVQSRPLRFTIPRWNFSGPGTIDMHGARFAAIPRLPILLVMTFANPQGREPLRLLPNGRANPEAVSAQLTDGRSERPPVFRRTDLVTYALVGLLVISIFTVLYLAKAFFLPVVMAFVVGTMLSPAA